MSLRKIVTIFLSISYIYAWSQHATIKVFDADTKQVLPYVNVCFESLDEKEKLFAVTDIKGQVKNPCTSSCKIAVSFVGYTTIIDTLKVGADKLYYLKPDVFNLDQVVITATRTEKALKDAPVITQVITSKDMSNRGINNVKDVLQEDIPGLEFQRGGFGADIKMQGLEAKNILILIDGERMAGESGNNVDYSRLNADNVERVEIVKGAASALYGSQAMGGVINIITKNPRKKLEISIGSRWAEINEKNYHNLDPTDDKFRFKDNLDRLNLDHNASIGFNLKRVSGRTDFSTKSFDAYQLYDKVPMKKVFKNIDTTIDNALNPFPTGVNAYKDYSIQQKINIIINKKIKLDLKGSYYNHDEYDFVPDNTFQNFEDYTYGAKLNYAISNKYSLMASYHTDNYQKFDYYEKLDKKKQNYLNQFINPKLLFFAEIGKYQQLTLGTEYLSDVLLSDKFSQDNLEEKASQTSVYFLQDDITVNKKINFIVGARTDIHSAFGAHFSPKLSGMYKYKNWAFRMNYAKGFRSPSLKELYMDWPIAWFTIKGDKNLQPETNNYISASSEYTLDCLNISATVYQNYLKNKIDGKWNKGQTVYQYVNVSQAELSGLELLAKFKILKHFVVSGAYSFLYDKRPQGELVSSASPHSGNIKIAYQLVHRKYQLNVNLSSVFTGAKDYEVSEQISYRGENVEGIYPVHFDAYSIWKLAISQQFLNGINLTMGIDNLWNYTADVVSFNTSMSPGRRAFVSLKINIDKVININNY